MNSTNKDILNISGNSPNNSLYNNSPDGNSPYGCLCTFNGEWFNSWIYDRPVPRKISAYQSPKHWALPFEIKRTLFATHDHFIIIDFSIFEYVNPNEYEKQKIEMRIIYKKQIGYVYLDLKWVQERLIIL